MKSVFSGIKVLDFTNYAAGPVAAATLGDYGAEVIKVERPVVGEDGRHTPPLIDGDSIFQWWYNHSKKSITVDMTDPEGIAFLKKIIADTDVIVESFRPGVIKRMGLDYESVCKIKPDIVYCSVSAFGQTGPKAQLPGYDLIAQALSGLLDRTGEAGQTPMKVGTILGDYVGAFNAYSAIVTAMYHKLNTGEGQYIDVALLDGLVYINGAFDAANLGLYLTRVGNRSNALSPYGLVSRSDGQYAVICAPNEKMWANLCAAMKNPELMSDPRFNSMTGRANNDTELYAVIGKWLDTFETIDEAVTILEKHDIPCAKVCSTKDVFCDEYFRERGMVVKMDLPSNIKSYPAKDYYARNQPAKLSKTPAKMTPSSALGEYNEEIFARYGYDKARMNALQEKWAERFTKH